MQELIFDVSDYDLEQDDAMDESDSNGIWDLAHDFLVDEVYDKMPEKADDFIGSDLFDFLQTDLYELIKGILHKERKD